MKLPYEVELEETGRQQLVYDDVDDFDADARGDEGLLPSADDQVAHLIEGQRVVIRRWKWAGLMLLAILTLVAVLAVLGQPAPGKVAGEGCVIDAEQAAWSARHVVVLGFDGMKPEQLSSAGTPRMDALRATGSYTFDARACIPTVSGPNWAAILAGVGPVGSGYMSNENVTYAKPLPGLDPRTLSIFGVLKRAGLSSLMINTNVGYCEWFGNYVSLDDVELLCTRDLMAESTESSMTYNQTIRAGLARIIATRPALSFFYVDQPDSTGHSLDWDSAPYSAAVSMIDGYVGMVIDALCEAGMANQTAVIIVTDHGGEAGHTYHGMYSDSSLKVPWIAWGAGVRAGKLTNPVRHLDTAPTILSLLSESYANLVAPIAWEGKPVVEALVRARTPPPPTPSARAIAARAVVVMIDGLSWDNMGEGVRGVIESADGRSASATSRSVGIPRDQRPYSWLVLTPAMDIVPLLWGAPLEEVGFSTPSMWLAAEPHSAPHPWPDVFAVMSQANRTAQLFAARRNWTSWAFDATSQDDCNKQQGRNCGLAADARSFRVFDSDAVMVQQVVRSIETRQFDLTLVRISELLELASADQNALARVDMWAAQIEQAVSAADEVREGNEEGTALFIVGTHAQASWDEVCAYESCGWTKQWACPPAKGSAGTASDDGSTGFTCCCKVEQTRERSLYPGAVQPLTTKSVGVPWIVRLPRGKRVPMHVAAVPVRSTQTIGTALATLGIAAPSLWSEPIF